MAEHKQKFGWEHVPEPHGMLSVYLVRQIMMSADGSEVLSRRPTHIQLSTARGGGPNIVLYGDKARSLGQALIEAADTFDEEKEASHGDRV